jgi:hypothetical protein
MITCFILTALFFQFNNGMIIGECQEPNKWKTWLNVHRPTATGLFLKIIFVLIIG